MRFRDHLVYSSPNLLGMICCSTSVGVLILTNCLEWRRRACGAQIPALGPRRGPQRVHSDFFCLRLETSSTGGSDVVSCGCWPTVVVREEF